LQIDGKNPDAILYEPVSKRVFTFNGRSRNATAIDAASGAAVGTVALDGRPEFAAADGEGSVFANIEDSSAVVRFDARTLAVNARQVQRRGARAHAARRSHAGAGYEDPPRLPGSRRVRRGSRRDRGAPASAPADDPRQLRDPRARALTGARSSGRERKPGST